MTEKRSNIKDLWNSFMLEGADFRQSKWGCGRKVGLN